MAKPVVMKADAQVDMGLAGVLLLKKGDSTADPVLIAVMEQKNAEAQEAGEPLPYKYADKASLHEHGDRLARTPQERPQVPEGGITHPATDPKDQDEAKGTTSEDKGERRPPKHQPGSGK